MDIKYYVLGKKNNGILLHYLNEYYKKLISYLIEIKKTGFLGAEIDTLLKKENRDFITSPDISSLIVFLHAQEVQKKNQNLGNSLFFIELLKKEILFFLNGEMQKLSMNMGSKIYGTSIQLTDIDNNPYNVNDSHPDHRASGGVLGWGDASQGEWLGVYEKTFAILKQADEGVYDELNQIIKKILPLGTGMGVHNSASYKECIGHLYMGFTIDSLKPEMNNLEAIIHESSHNKLNLIMQFDPLVLNNSEEKFYSPYRPDARHIHGIYLGVHALSATIYVLLRSYSQGLFGEDSFWLEKALLFHMKNKIGMKGLKKFLHATPLGIEILQEIEYVISLSDLLIKKIGPSQDIILRAQERQREHFSQVNNKYPYLQY